MQHNYDVAHMFTSIKFILQNATRDGSRTAATSKMEHFVIIVNDWKPLTIITKSFILDVAAVLDPPLATLQMFDRVLNTLLS